jgi:glutamate-1-semialdehyde 2,1-aminomutase
MCEAVKDLAEDEGIPIQVNSIASMFQLFFTRDEVINYESAMKADKIKFANYHKRLMENGVFAPPSQFETCFISSAHSKEDIKVSVEVFSDALKHVMK